MLKRCTKCQTEQAIENFALTKVRGRMLRRSWCNVCLKAYYKAYSLAKSKK
ncbi:MAG: hypothetical protein WCL32_17075 [Planctomycetota bacterium]